MAKVRCGSTGPVLLAWAPLIVIAASDDIDLYVLLNMYARDRRADRCQIDQTPLSSGGC